MRGVSGGARIERPPAPVPASDDWVGMSLRVGAR